MVSPIVLECVMIVLSFLGGGCKGAPGWEGKGKQTESQLAQCAQGKDTRGYSRNNSSSHGSGVCSSEFGLDSRESLWMLMIYIIHVFIVTSHIYVSYFQ